jgi:long-chain fatty acid transport protein
MNTSYDDNPFGAFGSTGRAGVDLSQLFVTGSLGYELSSGARLGVGLTHVYQKFRAEGIQSFAGMSSDPSAVSNQGYDSSTGWGIRLGWQRPINDSLTAGATWASRIDMAKLSKYQGLFAEQGGFDIPASYGFGLAAKLSPQWTLATDWEHIAYGDIKSIANPLSIVNPLGSDSGGGFGWKDVDVIKVGLIHTVDETLTLRGGISHAGQPIPDDQTFFNVLAPGVIEDHISIGATWTLKDDQEISLAFTHALNNKVEGTNSIPAAFGGGDADIEMNQNTFGLSWTSKF